MFIEEADKVFVSSASIWEAVIKTRLGKLDVHIPELVNSISLSGFFELPITIQHAAAVNNLDSHHRDPFDRILIAQAMIEPLKLLTSDELLKSYSVLVEVV